MPACGAGVGRNLNLNEERESSGPASLQVAKVPGSHVWMLSESQFTDILAYSLPTVLSRLSEMAVRRTVSVTGAGRRRVRSEYAAGLKCTGTRHWPTPEQNLTVSDSGFNGSAAAQATCQILDMPFGIGELATRRSPC